jgi:hypothetical protein
VLDRTLSQAIARISVRDAEEKELCFGTGFLVSADGLVLTAGHVVLDGEGVPLSNSIQLRFNTVPPFTTAAKIERKRDAGQSDWALLRCCTRPPKELAAIGLHQLAPHDFEVRWGTFGYARLYDPVGGFVRGDVRGATSVLDLAADELTGKAPSTAEGLSGSPCIVYGAAVGIIRTVLENTREIVAGTIRVVPVATVIAECGAPLVLPSDVPLPYDRHFTALMEALTPMALALACDVLQIPQPKVTNDPRTACRVARAMVMGGLKATIEVIVRLGTLIPVDAAEELWALAETLWVDVAAAKRLATMVDLPTQPPAVAINARTEGAARDFLDRACAERKVGLPDWAKHAIVISRPLAEPMPGSLVAAIREELARFGYKTPQRIKRHLSGRRPVTAIVVEQVPRADVLEEISKCEDLRGLHLLFLTHPKGKKDLGGLPYLEYVEPELPDGEEDRARDAKDFAYDTINQQRKALARLRMENRSDG